MEHRETSPRREYEREDGRELRAVVVEGDAQFGDFLRFGLEHEGVQVAAARSAPTARELIRAQQPDVIVLALTASSQVAPEVIQRLRAESSDVALLAIGAPDSVDERIAALEAGADDVMSRPIAFRELMARVRAVLRRRGTETRPSTLTFADLMLDPRTHVATRGRRLIALTPREFALLEFFLRHPRQILTRELILANVWGINHCGDDNVVEVYVHTLREKLGDRPPRLLQTVRGIGYVLREPADLRRDRRSLARRDSSNSNSTRPLAFGVGEAAM